MYCYSGDTQGQLSDSITLYSHRDKCPGDVLRHTQLCVPRLDKSGIQTLLQIIKQEINIHYKHLALLTLKNLTIKTFEIIISPVVLYGTEK